MALTTFTTDTLNKRRVLKKTAVRRPDHMNGSPLQKLKWVLVELGMLDPYKTSDFEVIFKRENGKEQPMSNVLLRAKFLSQIN